MIITIQEDAMGSLHIFEGKVSPFRRGAYLYVVDGKESSWFVQEGFGVEEVLKDLGVRKTRRQRLRAGYPITIKVSDEYSIFFNNQ